jgi:diguanylate cyclase (GGDEF)-like protein
MDSNVGWIAQCLGIAFLTLLAMFMRSSIRSVSLKFWTLAWSTLSLALLTLFIAFHVALRPTLLYSVYFLGQYLFGLVFITGCRREVERSNQELLEARDKLELLAQMDPLTEALNRHAFHSLLSRSERGKESMASGSVAVLDIDNLKPINDTWGHSTGDKAIRVVARSMRSLIRADDMLFRWGGDEFLVLMFKLSEEEASRRMKKLNEILEENCRKWPEMPAAVTVSHGVAGFNSLRELGYAIETADQAMYATRNEMRSSPAYQRVG